LIVFVLPIVVAGLLIRPYAGIVVAAICTSLVIAISYAIGLGLPNLPGIILFFMIGVIIYLTSNSLIAAQYDIQNKGRTARDAAATANLYLDLMGHDIRNHLQAIVIATEILEDEIKTLEDPEFFKMIVTSVTASQTLIEKVQQIRTLQDTPLELISINEHLDEVIKEIESLYDVHIIKLVEKKDMQVMADFHFKTLLYNILENCVIHNNKDSKVIWTQMMETPNGYEISVADNGPGIPDAKKEMIFDPERRFGGVGLHLAMRIVRKFNGALVTYDRIEKDPSQGSRFVIWLPQA
jgi:signal transduction histidine kinase